MDIRKFLVTLAKIIIPPAIGIFALLAIGFSLDPDTRMKYWYLCMAYFFPPLGKESVIPIGIAGGDMFIPIINTQVHIPPINPNVMAFSVALIDSVVSLFVVWNYDLVKKIPLLGRFVKKVEELGRKGSKEYAWVRPLRFTGIVLFVMVPFQGSGGLVGSILGRLIGMKPWVTWVAVTTGALAGCLLIAYFANILKSIFIKNFILVLAIIIIMVIVFGLYKIAVNNQKGKPNKK
ncbi:MAG: hypothetical protein DRN01_03950 [Thermoplasmata archaeon]|nr:MAG: hypothetical protein DRN01_03950 [Thermoplasmata archaeon]